MLLFANRLEHLTNQTDNEGCLVCALFSTFAEQGQSKPAERKQQAPHLIYKGGQPKQQGMSTTIAKALAEAIGSAVASIVGVTLPQRAKKSKEKQAEKIALHWKAVGRYIQDAMDTQGKK